MRITHRILTRKSILGFGRAHIRDLSVQQIIDSGNMKELIRAYYGLSKIDFTEDVLNEVGITQDVRIIKPGKLDFSEVSLKVNYCMDKWYSNKSEKEKLAAFTKNLGSRRKRLRARLKKTERINRDLDSLRINNHGSR